LSFIENSDRQRWPTNWRNKYQQAQFRWAIFFVDTDARAGGRRVAIHQYPKRNVPYSEDMGRSANRFTVQGYLVGKFGGSDDEQVNYLTMRDNLIECLEQDGPGMLRLPLPFQTKDVQVMVTGYSTTESRERGGFCTVEMEFVEFGDPLYRSTIATPAQIEQSANAAEKAVEGNAPPSTPEETAAYDKAYQDALRFIERYGPNP
jgi:DNA circularisation protein N-terminus